MLQDIAVITNGTYISSDVGLKLEDVTLMQLGEADTVLIDKDTTTIVGGKGDSKDIQLRITQVKAQIENTENPISKETIRRRLSKLSGGVGVLYVGATTEVEMKEKKDRVEDALQATKAAIEEGIVPGGGVAYIRSIPDLYNNNLILTQDERIGFTIVLNAIKAPLITILENGGLNSGAIIGKIEEGDKDFGFNARTENYEYFLESGVIDPTKVSRVALENAASIASMLLTTECVVANNAAVRELPTLYRCRLVWKQRSILRRVRVVNNRLIRLLSAFQIVEKHKSQPFRASRIFVCWFGLNLLCGLIFLCAVFKIVGDGSCFRGRFDK